MSWEFQDDGSVLGVATSRAVEWARGERERLAAIGFVAWCRDSGLDPFWSSNDWRVVACGLYIVEAVLDTSLDHARYDLNGHTNSPWFGAVRVMSGSPPVIHILGVSHTQPRSGPRSSLLSCREWLRAFPIHHVIPPEAFDEKRRMGADPAPNQHRRIRPSDARAA